MKPHYFIFALLLQDIPLALAQQQDIPLSAAGVEDSQQSAEGAQDIQILGLFKDKVVLQIQGKTHVLKLGEESDGIKLLTADSKQCTLLVHGRPQVFSLGSQVSVNFAPTQQPIVRIEQDSHGLYRVSGTINGQEAKFIVDTGATIVAMNVEKAMNLGIPYQEGKPMQVHTAGTSTQGYVIVLHEVAIGAIKVLDVPAVVVQNSDLQDVLLGRTFLNRVELKDEDKILELRQKY